VLCDVTVNYNSSESGIVQLQIFDPNGRAMSRAYVDYVRIHERN